MDIMEEVPRVEVLQRLQRQHLPVVLLPVEAPEPLDRADMDRAVMDKEVAMEEMDKDMEGVVTEEEVTVVVMEAV